MMLKRLLEKEANEIFKSQKSDLLVNKFMNYAQFVDTEECFVILHKLKELPEITLNELKMYFNRSA